MDIERYKKLKQLSLYYKEYTRKLKSKEMIFKNLPMDMIHYILSYNDTIKYRNGKYMNQICKTDKRYKILQRIKQIHLNDKFPGVYEVEIWYDLYYTAIYTLFSVDTDYDKTKIIYTFCYDCENNPEKYDLWVRN